MTRPHRRANSCCGGAPALAISCLLGLFAPAGAEEFLSAKIAGPQTGGAALDTGKPGSFDAEWATCPSVVHDGKQYRMYYSACYDAKMPRGGIGLATSDDGIHWRRANDGRPVLEPGRSDAWDGGQVMGPEVHYDGRVYRLWYTGMPVKRHSSGIGYYQIGLAISEDGLHFRRANESQPVLTRGPAGSADEVQAATPSIVRENDQYRMWYAAWSHRHSHTICAARSSDGIRWERENDGRPIAGLRPAEAYGHAVCKTDRWIPACVHGAASRTGTLCSPQQGWSSLDCVEFQPADPHARRSSLV